MPTAQSEHEESQINEPDEREATELGDYENAHRSPPVNPTTTVMDNEAIGTNMEPPRNRRKSAADMIRTFWKRHVVVIVPHEACRDHFGTYFVNNQLIGRFTRSLFISQRCLPSTPCPSSPGHMYQLILN